MLLGGNIVNDFGFLNDCGEEDPNRAGLVMIMLTSMFLVRKKSTHRERFLSIGRNLNTPFERDGSMGSWESGFVQLFRELRAKASLPIDGDKSILGEQALNFVKGAGCRGGLDNCAEIEFSPLGEGKDNGTVAERHRGYVS